MPTRPAPVKADAFAEGRALFGRNCAGCHLGSRRNAPKLGPGYNSRVWIKGFLLNPRGDDYFGRTKITGMKPVAQRGAELDALVELVYAQTGAKDARPALVSQGRALFDASCTKCHSLDGKSPGKGPNLGGRGSADGLAALIAEPGHPRWFGNANEMPRFGDKLNLAERRSLASYVLSWQRASD